MSRLTKAAAGAVLAAVMLFPAAARAQEIAVVTVCKGTVQAKADGEGTEWTDVQRGDMLASGSLVLTGGDGFTIIKFLDDKSSVKVMPNSGLKITAKGSGRALSKELMLKVGSVFADVKKGKKKKFRIETATAVATVKGTRFWMVKQKAGSELEQKIETLNTILELEGQFKKMAGILAAVRGQDDPASDPGKLVEMLGLRKEMDVRAFRQLDKFKRYFGDDDDIVSLLPQFKEAIYTAMRAFGAVIQGKGDKAELLDKTDAAMDDAGAAVKKLAALCRDRLDAYKTELEGMDNGEVAKVMCTEGVVEMFNTVLKKKMDVSIGRTGTCTKKIITVKDTDKDDLPRTGDGDAAGDEFKFRFRNKDGEQRVLDIKVKRK